MKICILIIAFIIVENSIFAQDNTDVYLKVQKIADTINDERDLKVVLLIGNHTQFPVLLPSKYLFMPYNDNTEFYYRIKYRKGRKKTELTKFVKDFSINHTPAYSLAEPKYIVIDSNSTEKIICNLDYSYFQQSGEYFVKFYYRVGKVNRCNMGILSTQWMRIHRSEKAISFP